jgi:hypothetical protein
MLRLIVYLEALSRSSAMAWHTAETPGVYVPRRQARACLPERRGDGPALEERPHRQTDEEVLKLQPA